MIRNIMLGNQTASNTGILPLTANILDMVVNKIYSALRAMPTPICSPIPPRIFLEERDTPISININAANGLAKRL